MDGNQAPHTTNIVAPQSGALAGVSDDGTGRAGVDGRAFSACVRPVPTAEKAAG